VNSLDQLKRNEEQERQVRMSEGHRYASQRAAFVKSIAHDLAANSTPRQIGKTGLQAVTELREVEDEDEGSLATARQKGKQDQGKGRAVDTYPHSEAALHQIP